MALSKAVGWRSSGFCAATRFTKVDMTRFLEVKRKSFFLKIPYCQSEDW